MYNQGSFAAWVPKPVMLLLIAVILFPMISVMGVYAGNTSDIAGALAIYPEYISLANNATTIGMGIALLIIFRVKKRFRSKEIITGSALILALLSYMNGTTDNAYVLVTGSFLIGFFKMFPLIEMIIPVLYIITPTNDRGRFYAIFYPLTICFGQLSSYLMSSLIFQNNWQAPYFFMSIVMLVIAACSQIFQHNQRFCFKVPLYQVDWLSMLLLATSAMGFNVGFTFMKQQGWFTSPYIIAAFLIGLVFFFLTVYRQRFLKRKMFNFSLFYKLENVKHSIILLLFLGIYLASSSIYVQYSMGVLGHSNLINAHTNLWMIPGIIIAGMLALYGFKKNWPLKLYIAAGFISFFLHTLSLYLLIQPQMDIQYLEYAMILKGLGMGILFIGIWFYASQNVSMEDIFGVNSILIMIRTFIATAIGSSIIGWATYQSQWQSLNDLSMHLDAGHFANRMSIYSSTMMNALMASSKIVLGTLCWLSIPILIYVLTHHYGQLNARKVVYLRKMIRGSSIKGYRFS